MEQHSPYNKKKNAAASAQQQHAAQSALIDDASQHLPPPPPPPISPQQQDISTQLLSKTNEVYVVDALTAIIKLVILSKKSIGTKICVYNNVLYIHEAGLFQSIIRYIYNVNKIDVSYLYNPIKIACAQYLGNAAHKKNPKIVKLFRNAQIGIKKLSNTYKEYKHIVHILYLYYNIIQNYLADAAIDDFISDSLTPYYNENVMDISARIWTPSKFGVLLNMIDYIQEDTDNRNIRFVEEFINHIDREFVFAVNGV